MSRRQQQVVVEVNEAKRARLHAEEVVEEGEVEVQVQDLLGVQDFGSTKNAHVADNSKTAARGGRAPKQSRKARQYMNRKPKNGDNSDKSTTQDKV